jgi:hypothetical protein
MRTVLNISPCRDRPWCVVPQWQRLRQSGTTTTTTTTAMAPSAESVDDCVDRDGQCRRDQGRAIVFPESGSCLRASGCVAGVDSITHRVV